MYHADLEFGWGMRVWGREVGVGRLVGRVEAGGGGCVVVEWKRCGGSVEDSGDTYLGGGVYVCKSWLLMLWWRL